MTLRAVAEVNVAAIERNAAQVNSQLRPGTELCAVVKADGYGHGAAPSARAALAGGAGSLAVATAGEAAELRAAGVEAKLLILGAISDEELPVAVAARCALAVWDPAFVPVIAAQARHTGSQVRVHVKFDSGLGRLGTRDLNQALAVAQAVTDHHPELALTGAMTHFATADDDQDFVAEQLRRFLPFVTAVRAFAGPDFKVHAANSAATLLTPAAHFDMVRAGLALYGGDPMNVSPDNHGLEPALTLRSYVAAVKPVDVGESTGYGRRFIATRATNIATLPIGYGDGLPRALANNLEVLIGGCRYPVCGMVSMDNITVDVGPEPVVARGQLATIIGADGQQRQTAEAIAKRLGTISYEVFCLISRRVPRVYHRDGQPL